MGVLRKKVGRQELTSSVLPLGEEDSGTGYDTN